MTQPALPLEERVSNTDLIRIFCKLDKRSLSRQITFSPTDFGQARMAALGWLMSLAEKQGAGQSEAVIAAFRQAAGKSPADLRSLWDWFYLCAVRLDNAGVFEAAKSLSRAAPTDTTALWAHLHSVGGRGLRPVKVISCTNTARPSQPKRRHWTKTTSNSFSPAFALCTPPARANGRPNRRRGRRRAEASPAGRRARAVLS